LNNVLYNINFTTKVSPSITTTVTTIFYSERMVLMFRRKGWMVIQESYVMSTEITCERSKLERGDRIHLNLLYKIMTCVLLYKINGVVDFLFQATTF
jgi:hypothetical protein